MINVKDDRLKKIHMKKIKDDFILVCPVCGYSFRSKRSFKDSHITQNRCPMCGYKWTRPDFFSGDQNSSAKNL
jgi:rubrerythrin